MAGWISLAKATGRQVPSMDDNWYEFTTFNLQRIHTKKGIVWGGLLMTTPACYNFAGIAINRFLLGLVEAVVNPGFVLLMSMWYTSKEQPLRLEAYYCTNGIATMFGG
jgi:MFS family permease